MGNSALVHPAGRRRCDKIEAGVAKGVLTVTVPKTAHAAAKKIEVRSAG
jgi:HSP20 family molecular chaperone IbpA